LADAHGEVDDRGEAGSDAPTHGAWDPHAWQSLRNARIYVENIAAGLSAADPARAEAYRAKAAAYLAEIDALDGWVRQTLAALPEGRRTIVTSHEALGYFAAEYGLRILAPVGMGPEAETSAAEVAALIREIKKHAVRAVFLENIAN